MARFYFDIDDGEQFEPDEQGEECGDAQAARDMALRVVTDIAREKLPDGSRRDLVAHVRDETGRVLLRATLSLTAEWVEPPAAAPSPE